MTSMVHVCITASPWDTSMKFKPKTYLVAHYDHLGSAIKLCILPMGIPLFALRSIVYSKHHRLLAFPGGQEIPSHPERSGSQVNQGLVPSHPLFLEGAAHTIASA